jgi:ribonuclease HII
MWRTLLLIVAGVDEAGRGSVIGPLIIAAASFSETDEKKLSSLGVKDSKSLSPNKRTKLASKIITIANSYSYFELQPWAIDKVVKRGKRLKKLNYLEAMAMAKTIRDLRPDKVFVDAADVIPKRFGDEILRVLDWSPFLVCEKMADVKYPVVSAASILAKVKRDQMVSDLRDKHGDFGSGYPSDPKTVLFIRNWFDNNDEPLQCMRSSWSTIKRLR